MTLYEQLTITGELDHGSQAGILHDGSGTTRWRLSSAAEGRSFSLCNVTLQKKGGAMVQGFEAMQAEQGYSLLW